MQIYIIYWNAQVLLENADILEKLDKVEIEDFYSVFWSSTGLWLRSSLFQQNYIYYTDLGETHFITIETFYVITGWC